MSSTAPPGTGTTIPSTEVTTTSPAGVIRKRQISDLITHIAKSDNHLWQALTSLQNQTNGLVGIVTDWTAWDPQIVDDTGNVLASKELAGYYMTNGRLCFIEIHGQVTVTAGASNIQVSLPMDIGETIIKTCTAYLTSTDDNGVIGVEARKRVVVVTIKPSFRGLTCKFMMGGDLGIIQGS